MTRRELLQRRGVGTGPEETEQLHVAVFRGHRRRREQPLARLGDSRVHFCGARRRAVDLQRPDAHGRAGNPTLSRRRTIADAVLDVPRPVERLRRRDVGGDHVGHRVGRHVLRRQRDQGRREDLGDVDIHPLEQQRRRRAFLQHVDSGRARLGVDAQPLQCGPRRPRGRSRSGGDRRRSRCLRRISGWRSRAAPCRARRRS